LSKREIILDISHLNFFEFFFFSPKFSASLSNFQFANLCVSGLQLLQQRTQRLPEGSVRGGDAGGGPEGRREAGGGAAAAAAAAGTPESRLPRPHGHELDAGAAEHGAQRQPGAVPQGEAGSAGPERRRPAAAPRQKEPLRAEERFAQAAAAIRQLRQRQQRPRTRLSLAVHRTPLRGTGRLALDGRRRLHLRRQH